MNKCVTPHFTILRKTKYFMRQVFELKIIIFFYNKRKVKKCSLRRTKGSLVFSLINLVAEMFINSSEAKDETPLA
jgi:hypothetical protein